MAKHKYIETPEKLWQLFEEYKKDVKNNPISIVEQKKGNTILPKDLSKVSDTSIKQILSSIVELPAQRPLTLEGFENYVADLEIISDLSNYFANSNGAYEEYSTICQRIKRVIRQDQIEGGMVGIYNPSITQRLNGLVEKTDNNIKVEREIFNGLDLDVKS